MVLFPLALDAQPQPQLLSLSPATLKSLVGALIDVLIEQQVPATLWVKLPPGEIWQAEIERYQHLVGVQHTIYLCQTSQSVSVESTSISQIFPIQLADESHLNREYFLLVLSPKFCGVILVTRSRQFKAIALTTSNKKPRLPVIYACDLHTTRQVLQGIKQFIPKELSTVLEGADAFVGLPEMPDSAFLAQLLVKQVQRQEEITKTNVRTIALGAYASPLPTFIRQNALSLKDEFISHVVEELRMPLTNMKTALTLIESTQIKGAQRQRYLHLLHAECDRQNSLISSLLEVIQLDREPSSELHPLYLIDIVPSIVSTYQPLAQEKGIQLGYTVPDNIPPVSCLETWLRQIVINLLHNSIKYTPTGGQVSVKALVEGNYVQLEFRDTGIGIASGEMPKIFDRFYRGRPAIGNMFAGAGLGLTIVQQLIRRCGGEISVTSRQGVGSTFKVLLPIHHSDV